MNSEKPTAIDLFCGCGAVSQGLKKKFKVIAAVDNDPTAAATYRINHPKVNFFQEDITEIKPEKISPIEAIDLMVVCAPCQPFSSQNNSRNSDDRENLILEAIRFAKIIQPKVIFFENVRGIKKGPIITKLIQGLKKEGYDFWTGPSEINAADYGVPQRRHRCILLCSRKKEDLPEIPSPISDDKRRTVRQAIANLPSLESGEQSRDILHFARRHSPIALERFNFIPENGGSRNALPDHLVLACHKKYRGHPDVYGRMEWDSPAPTLTTGCTDVTRGRYIHPKDNRAISLREAARLQTFPDSYKFHGCSSEIARQIGNAVPVKMAEVLATAIASVF